MVALLSPFRKVARLLTVVALAGLLAACGATNVAVPSVNSRSVVPVALLVPASNPQVGPSVARSLENAARLAAQDLQGVEIDLRVYDTAGNPELAARRAQEAVQDGAKVIIGPLFAEAAASAGVAVQNRNVNVLAFSNNPAVAGGNVFILGNTFQTTADRLVRYANAQGRGNIFIVHGNSTEEGLGRDAIRGAINASGAQLAGLETFEMSQQAVIESIPTIAQRIELSGATAMFLTSGTDGALPLLADLLPENGVDPAEVQLIGLRRFDIPSSALTLTGIQGGWFALPDPATSRLFAQRYAAAYGQPPHPLAGLAYDGIAAIGALVASGESGVLTARSLTQPAGFAGANGVFRLRPDGTNERALAVAQVENNQVIVIDPAPRSFGDIGF